MKAEYKDRYIKIGLKVSYYRKLSALTQEQLASELHISSAYVGRLEIGLGSPSLDMAIQLSAFFNVPLDYLILGINLPSRNAKQIVHAAVQTLLQLEKEL